MTLLAVVTIVVEAETAVLAMTAKPGGAACTALAEMATTSPAAPTPTPRLANNSRKRYTARLTRFCAASSLTPSTRPTASNGRFWK